MPKQWSSGTQAISATNKQNKIKIQIKRQWKYQPHHQQQNFLTWHWWKTATVTTMTSVGNTSLTMTTTKAFLTGQKQQQQLCCTTKVHCINMAGSAQHNKHNKAEQSQCVDLWHLWDRTNNQRNQVIKQLDEGDGTRQIAKQQTNTVSLRHTTNTA